MFGALLRLLARIYSIRRRIATAVAAMLVVGFGFHVVFGQNGLIAYEQKREDTKTLDGELKNLQRENDALKEHVDRLQSDPSAIEHQAREELHYTRPGEVIYTLPAAKSDPSAKN
jgi:cell division protein FtsB